MATARNADEVLDALTNAAEPTWILLEGLPVFNGDRLALETILRELERKRLVTRSRELSGKPDQSATALDDWWALTEEGWATQGRKMPRGYDSR